MLKNAQSTRRLWIQDDLPLISPVKSRNVTARNAAIFRHQFYFFLCILSERSIPALVLEVSFLCPRISYSSTPLK